MLRMEVDDEVLVGCVRVHARRRLAQGAVGARKEPLDQRAHAGDLVVAHRAPNRLGGGGFALVVQGDLHAVAEIGESVPRASRCVFVDEDREPLRREIRWCVRIEPEDRVALDIEGEIEFGKQLADPRARGDDQALRREGAAGSDDFDSVGGGTPRRDALAEAELRSQGPGERELRVDGGFGACSSAQPSYARLTSGTYSGSSKYVSRMMRDLPCDDPNACGGVNWSMPNTLCPRRAR